MLHCNKYAHQAAQKLGALGEPVSAIRGMNVTVDIVAIRHMQWSLPLLSEALAALTARTASCASTAGEAMIVLNRGKDSIGFEYCHFR